MKKILLLLMTAVMLLGALPCSAEEPILINKINDPENPFTFPEDAQLLEIYFPNICDSMSLFIRYGEYSMLLDCAGEQWVQVQSMLNDLGVTELTYTFASHPHTDHMGGMQHLLKEIKTASFIHAFPEDYPYNDPPVPKVYAELHSQDVPFRLVQDGDTIDFGDVKMTVYQCWNELFSENNNSAMLMIEYGERSFLFTADVQADAMLTFVDRNIPIQADIMTHPHHGYNKMQYPFLTMVDPELVIVTSGSWSAEGVPNLKYFGYAYHYTNMGVMRMATDGQTWVIERFN